MPKLKVIIASTRPGRAGLPISQWFIEEAKKHNKFEIEVLDLAEINLPLLDEPNHPRMRQYTQEHTKKWSEKINNADAFVVVTPEYNYGSPAALINAFDYLFHEWNYKPIGFVSYGGLSGGTRSVQMTKQIVTTLKMMPLPEAVNIPFFNEHIKDGKFTGTESQVKALHVMLDELLKWTSALQQMRNK